MGDITRILADAEQGAPRATDQLFIIVYDELRRLAAGRLAHEGPGQTLDPTALVHEAWLRLAAPPKDQGRDQPDARGAAPAGNWQGRAHFFAAAAEAMRRILIDRARRKNAARHGGAHQRVELTENTLAVECPADQMLLLDEALERLASRDRAAALLVKLRYYTGCSVEDAAEMAGLPRATAYRHWSFARAWLLNDLDGKPDFRKPRRSQD